MSRHRDCFSQVLEVKLVPAVRARTADLALRALKALHAGGLSVFEVPLTVPGALQLLPAAREILGKSVLIGSGTVLDAESARAALLAGADFLVSPSLTIDVIRVAQRYGVPVFSGALTPTEILSAWEAGSDCVKVFPASALGGPSYIRAVHAPLPLVELMPMGGVTLNTAADYLRAGACLLGVGADLVDGSALDRNDDAALTITAEQYVDVIRRMSS